MKCNTCKKKRNVESVTGLRNALVMKITGVLESIVGENKNGDFSDCYNVNK